MEIDKDEFLIYLEKLQEERKVLIAYLGSKMETEDWHGVADAAMDLRDVDSAVRAVEHLQTVTS